MLNNSSPASSNDPSTAQRVWEDVEPELTRWLVSESGVLTDRMQTMMKTELKAQRDQERKRFQDRKAELEAAIRNTTLERLRREAEEYRAQAKQGDLFDPDKRFALEQEAAALEEERVRRVGHYEELRATLERERERVLERMLPHRYTLRGQVRLFPIAVEIRLPGTSR
jgi:hypothetical protein